MGYLGPLNIKKMNDVQAKAYKSWKDQGQRCDNPNDKGYKHWGAKGIKRIYSSRDFISWYEQEYAKRDNWIRPNVDRIDNAKNYEFSNIRLLECSENTKLRNEIFGNPTPSKKIKCINKLTQEVLFFDSVREASRSLGVLRTRIQAQISNTLKRKSRIGYTFEQI